jgi:hypothetical protein
MRATTDAIAHLIPDFIVPTLLRMKNQPRLRSSFSTLAAQKVGYATENKREKTVTSLKKAPVPVSNMQRVAGGCDNALD